MKSRAFWYAFSGLLWALVPVVVSAATLVPCGVNGDSAAATCNLCTFGQLLQNIINFAIGLSIPVSAILFSYAGWLYFSNRENMANIERAHKIFTSVLIGFVIAIAGWLIVQTILKTLAPGYQSWTTFTCNNADRPMNGSIGNLLQQSGVGQLNNALPVSFSNGQISGSGMTCATDGTCYNGAGQTLNSSGSGIVCDVTLGCFNNDGTAVPISKEGGTQGLCNNSNCSADFLQSDAGGGFSPTEAQAMSCIAITENSGNSAGCNGNACGTYQIMLTANPLSGSACARYNPNGGDTLNCPALCKGANGYAAKNEASCQPCVQAANDAQCNAQSAQNLYAQSGYSPWLGAAAGGQSDNTKAAGCVQKYDPTSDSL